MQRQQWTRNGKSLRDNSSKGMWEKSRVKRIKEVQKSKNKVHFASLMGTRRRTEFCTLLQLFAWIRSEERSQESSSLNSPCKWKQALVVPSRGTACLWDKILQVNLKGPGSTRYSLKCELGKKEVWTPNVVLVSELRNKELRMVQKTLEICFSETHASGNRDVWIKVLSTQAMLIPDAKGDNGKGMKGGHKEGTQRHKVRKVHFVALMDIRHIQKYECIPENVRKSNLKCGNYQA